jgi:hypothetical protein
MSLKPSLVFCIVMDLLGAATYILPFLGESFDMIFAPISAVVYYFTFGGKLGIMGGTANFIEEILPGTDIIPTFTITWLILRYKAKHPVE